MKNEDDFDLEFMVNLAGRNLDFEESFGLFSIPKLKFESVGYSYPRWECNLPVCNFYIEDISKSEIRNFVDTEKPFEWGFNDDNTGAGPESRGYSATFGEAFESCQKIFLGLMASCLVFVEEGEMDNEKNSCDCDCNCNDAIESRGVLQCELKKRKIVSHEVEEAPSGIELNAVGMEGAGGANCLYEAGWKHSEDSDVFTLVQVPFQEGPIQDNGVNGLTNEVLLAIVKDRLECFQNGKYPCKENAAALDGINFAIEALKSRTRSRVQRGVEGKLTS